MILRTSCWGKPAWVGVYVSEHLSFACLGKTSRGKPRSKPESGNPTFRDCRGARGNVTLSFMTECARLGSIPTRSRQSLIEIRPLSKKTLVNYRIVFTEAFIAFTDRSNFEVWLPSSLLTL